ncbi:MAG: NAD-dependent deacylase [Anaerolineae bacterium]|jgi:NAD-dependent deacetylase|nr:NAD-dependent deacylase [Anaerolineae bacterium]MBT7069284.1 NAD-dependent deacylase [Anaerolineae bacterium]MBT7326000.1 NAD-dependent deacylase [Anaerolineae bacterium]
MPTYQEAAQIIKNASHVTVFTGAGISVESGIPPFRGENGLWNTYDPIFLDIRYFHANPRESWQVIKEIFYDFFGQAHPNAAHLGIAQLEKDGYVKATITQNIDNLHQDAGSIEVYEYHGNSRNLICTSCGQKSPASHFDLNLLPPLCIRCSKILKPDFIFYGEAIPEPAMSLSFQETEQADVFLLVGTTGEVMPAAQLPHIAKRNGAKIIEINIEPSLYTQQITDIFLQGKATVAITNLLEAIEN